MLYIRITTSKSLVLSTCVLFILLMQSVNGAQLVLFAASAAAVVSATDIVALTSIYASL